MLMTSGPPRRNASTELVVPRSIPMSAMILLAVRRRFRGGSLPSGLSLANNLAALHDLHGVALAHHPEVADDLAHADRAGLAALLRFEHLEGVFDFLAVEGNVLVGVTDELDPVDAQLT